MYRFARNNPISILDRLGLYDVSGTPREIEDKMVGDIGAWRASWSIEARHVFQGTKEIIDCSCPPSNMRATENYLSIASVSVSGTIDLPNWVDIPDGEYIKRTWDEFVDKIRKHEEGHKAVDEAIAQSWNGRSFPWSVSACKEKIAEMLAAAFMKVDIHIQQAVLQESDEQQELYHDKVGNVIVLEF